jgi:signal peptidase II
MLKTAKGLRWVWLSIVVLLADQIVKYLVATHMVLYQSITILPFFDLTLLHNRGMAFSFLSNQPGWQTWVLSIFAIVICIFIIVWLTKTTRAWVACGLALILGGALGNLIDRIRLGYVIDYLDFHIRMWHWPSFNIADSAVCIGAVMLLLELAFRRK